MPDFAEIETEFFPKWKCRQIWLKPVRGLEDPIFILYEVILQMIEKYQMEDHVMVHLCLSQADSTAGFTMNRMRNGEIITVEKIKQLTFADLELGQMANKILNSNESWSMDENTKFRIQFFMIPRELIRQHAIKRKREDEK